MKYRWLIILALVACTAPEVETHEVNDIELHSELLDSIEVSPAIPNIQQDNFENAKLLWPSSFHSDEMPDNFLNLKWMGLFHDFDGRSYLANADVQSKEIYDPVVDEEGEKSGYEVTVKSVDDCVFIVSGIDFLFEREVPSTNLGQTEFLPGEEFSLDFNADNYSIFATGDENNNGGYTYYTNYKLHLTRSFNGEFIDQIILEVDGFDDNMVTVMFAGDIDGDGILDLYVDTSHKYSFTQPTLFLSSLAGQNEIVKKVVEMRSAGC